jgi:surface antigen/LysM repeat protein
MGVTHSTAATKQQEPVRIRRKAGVRIKPSLIAIYASVFILVVAIISVGYHQPQSTTAVANAANVNSSSVPANQTSVDSVVAATVAAGVAQTTNLPVAATVSNLAVSAQSQSVFTESDSISSTKPQIIASVTDNRLVTNYVVQASDTMASLTAKFSISAQTIEWANDMTSDTLTVGSNLRILPIDGVLYTVKSGDTVDLIATKYAVDKTQLVVYNDLDVSGLVVGSKIILPSGTLPTDERPGYVAPVVYNYYAGLGAGFGGDTWHISNGTGSCPTYAYGYCTCYAYYRRLQLGLGVGTNWGDASSWASNAAINGYVVNHIPSVGAIMQNGGGSGHVAIVESIAANGDLGVSEMNAYVAGGGWNIVSGRTVSVGNVSQYLYIH